MNILQNSTVVGKNAKTRFQGVAGVAPYFYSVISGGAGGSIDVNGIYTAPGVSGIDTIQVTDSDTPPSVETATVNVLSPLQMVCNIIQTQLGLDEEQVYIWDQKTPVLNDSKMYVALSIDQAKQIGNNNRFNGNSDQSNQYVTMLATVGMDIFSRSFEALDRKEEIVLALKSNYAQNIQESNNFFIGKLTTSFLNISQPDGAAIPYRYKLSFYMQYAVGKNTTVPYFDEISGPDVKVDP